MNHDEQKREDRVNPFAEEAAVGAAIDALKDLEWKAEMKRRLLHLDACEAIMRVGVLSRLTLAAEALREWGNDVVVVGVEKTETFTGVVHLRARMTADAGTAKMKQIEFIASPKSMVIAAEACSGYEKRRWKKIALTAEGISGHCDEIIRSFMTWGWVKRV